MLIHCRQGIGRSSLLAAAVLEASSLDEAWRRIAEARGRSVPDTPEQRAWLQASGAIRDKMPDLR